jgi:uncharacterized membrane protein YgcG
MVQHVETAHWRATTREVGKLMDEIKEAVAGAKGDAAVVLGMTDNSFYMARTEDGSLIPHRRDLDGKYHIDGDILCSPLESSRQVFLQLIPLLNGLQEVDKVLLAPLPRYLYNSCCMDMEHGPNVADPDHCDQILAGIVGLQKLWRGMAFRERLRNLRVINVGPKIAAEAFWMADAVHLTDEGYAVAANFIMGVLDSMEERRRVALDDSEESGPGKRGLDRSEDGQSVKRPAASQGDFAARSDQQRGRGVWHHRGGSGFGGFGGFRGGRGFGGGGGGNWRGGAAMSNTGYY